MGQNHQNQKMVSQLTGHQIIQLHPSLRCNLRCKHCYSSSAPEYKTELNADLVNHFLDYAKEYDFNTLSVSGGEPFMYGGLENVLTKSKQLGFKNLAASNGMLFKSSKAKRVLSLIDVLAISIDGNEEIHDNIRGMNGAFAKMIEGVKIVSDLKKSFGFIHTITSKTWKILPWLTEFAHQQGASILQLHPLEFHGRAEKEFVDGLATPAMMHQIFIYGSYLRNKYLEKLFIQMDFLHKNTIVADPRTVSYQGQDFKVSSKNFATAIQSLSIDEKGGVYPIAYGFSDFYKIGTLQEVQNGVDIFDRYMKNQWSGFYQLLEKTFNDIISDQNEQDLVAWTEMITLNSQKIEAHELVY